MPAAEPRGRSPVTARRGRLVLHVLSDSTGETASAAASAVLSQFDGLEVRRRQHVFVRAPRDVDAALARIGEEPGVVVYTLTDAALALRLREGCDALGARAVALLDPFFEAVADETGAERSLRPGRQHGIGGSYFARVAAMDYAMTQDDGATPDRLRRADVVLLGVSRTSKTPTCLYLAVRGVKAANVPLVPGRALPEGLDAALAAGVPGVGLTASPARLAQIRSHRLEALGGGAEGADYADLDRIRDEVASARLVFERLDLPVIDVTRRSIEETAASVMALIRDRQDGAA